MYKLTFYSPCYIRSICCIMSTSLSYRANSSLSSESTLKHLSRKNDKTVAYRQTEGKTPGVIFLPGFMSNMNGGKAVALERSCRETGRAYVRFDYQGCGESNGSLQTGAKAFDVWKSDALAVLDQVTSGPQILVGSSMGGALMLLLALERPQRIQGLVGVATAVDFTNKLSYTEVANDEMRNADGPLENETYVTPKDFVDKHYQRCLMDDHIAIHCPVRLLHGMKDDTVPFMTSLNVAQRVLSKDVDVILRKHGDHRLSRESDIHLLIETVESLIEHNKDSGTTPTNKGEHKL